MHNESSTQAHAQALGLSLGADVYAPCADAVAVTAIEAARAKSKQRIARA